MNFADRSREENLEILLTDIRLCAANFARLLNDASRAELRRADGRVDAFYRWEKATRDLQAADPSPADPRPEPPEPRLPYRDD